MGAMRTFFITGSTGEIGNALSRLLVDEGATVYAVCRPGSRRLDFLSASERLHVLECDIFDLDRVAASVREPCDAFFHLGWHAAYGRERRDPYGQVRNIAAALDAVKLAGKLGCSVFVGAGSQAQYGETGKILTPETPMRPSSAYGAAKACAEHMTRELCAREGIRHVWGRVVSVYGPCDGPYTLVSYLMRTALAGEEALVTPCEQVWDYLFADDAARAFIAMARAGKNGKAYCVASGTSRPLGDYVEDFRRVAGEKARVRIGGIPYAPNQRMRLAADISALRDDTGFEPLVPFGEGIRQTWQWYAQHPEALNFRETV